MLFTTTSDNSHILISHIVFLKQAKMSTYIELPPHMQFFCQCWKFNEVSTVRHILLYFISISGTETKSEVMQRTRILAFLSHQEDCGKNDKSLECPEVIETGSDLQL